MDVGKEVRSYESGVSEFYRSKKCPTSALISRQHTGKSYVGNFYDCLKAVCTALGEGKGKDEIVEIVNRYCTYKKGESFNENELPVKAGAMSARDKAVFARFLDWHFSRDAQVVEANHVAHAEGFNILVNLILAVKEGDGTQYEAMVIRMDNKDGITPKGRSVKTRLGSRLEGIIPKVALEEKYNGIRVAFVSLISKDDKKGLMETFSITKNAASQYHVWDGEELVENGEIKRDAVEEIMAEIKSMDLTAERKCAYCSKARLCALSRAKNDVLPPPKAFPNILTCSSEQSKVVKHRGSDIVVIAPPGSGKTASLVARVKSLVKEGVKPHELHLLAFTNKAVEELRLRLEGVCQPEQISTLHSYAIRILTESRDRVDNGGGLRLLSDETFTLMIFNTLSGFVKLDGIDYTKPTWGRHGLISLVEHMFREFTEEGTEAFFEANPEVDRKFADFAISIQCLLDEGGYLSFDEVIPKAVEILRENPNIARTYRRRYVMVDEYQDISADQEEFIRLLSDGGELCCVGDEDQAIYGWRGGTNKYMLSFEEIHKGAKRVVLTQNYRSVPDVVRESSRLISGNAKRTNKRIEAQRPSIGGVQFIERGGMSLEEVIERLRYRGVSYGDIAILGRNNEVLHGIHNTASFPTRIEKSALTETVAFNLLYECLRSILLPEGSESDLAYVLDRALPELKGNSNKLMEALKGGSPVDAVKAFLDYVKKRAHIAPERALAGEDKLIEMADASDDSLMELYKAMRVMVLLDSNSERTKVDRGITDEVRLLTAHEAKGKEFRAVIVYRLSDFDPKEVLTGDGDEEDIDDEEGAECRRVLYVAMTRAEDFLILMDNGNYSSVLLSEQSKSLINGMVI